LLMDEVNVPLSYSKFFPLIQNTIEDEKDIQGSDLFGKWVKKFSLLHKYDELKQELKLPFQTEANKFRDIISNKRKNTTEIREKMINLAVSFQIHPEMVYKLSSQEAHDFKRQELASVLDIEVNEAEIEFYEKKNNRNPKRTAMRIFAAMEIRACWHSAQGGHKTPPLPFLANSQSKPQTGTTTKKMPRIPSTIKAAWAS